jgi:hypothetical protein
MQYLTCWKLVAKCTVLWRPYVPDQDNPRLVNDASVVYCFLFYVTVPHLVHTRELLPEDRIEWLRQELLQAIARSSSGPAFITTKLCQAVRVLHL